MGPRIEVQPLPYKERRRTFLFLILIFLVSLPFLYMYATGYRINFNEPTNLISTGGIYIATVRTGAEIYIDNDLVRESRIFKKAFYVQNIDAGTHRIHVQAIGYHTWVKELPVSKRLVTEVEAFNLPLVSQVRVISEWLSSIGSPVIHTPLLIASTTQSIIATTSKATTTLTKNTEYLSLRAHFSTSTETVKKDVVTNLHDTLVNATTSNETKGTTTITSNGVRLGKAGEELMATWIGSFEEMPYYYCAPPFPAYSTTSINTLVPSLGDIPTEEVVESEKDTLKNSVIIHPVQTVPKDTPCEPVIRIDRKGQTILSFDFLPGSIDFVVVALNDGIYVIEVDDRSWQNVQPLIKGENLQFYIENGNIYVYDGVIIYQVFLEIPE